MRLYDVTKTKSGAQDRAQRLRKEGVQYVRVVPVTAKKWKRYGYRWQILVGGKNSQKWS